MGTTPRTGPPFPGAAVFAGGGRLEKMLMLARVDLTLDAADPTRLAALWKVAVGYVDEPPPAPFGTREEWRASFDDADDDDGMGGEWLHDPRGMAPRLSILQVPEPKTAKNRLHMDLRVSGTGSTGERWSRITAEVQGLRLAGAGVVQDCAPHHVVMADPEGNEFCVA